MNRDKLFSTYASSLLRLKKTAAEAHRLLSEVYGDETPLEETYKVWFKCSRNGNFETNNIRENV